MLEERGVRIGALQSADCAGAAGGFHLAGAEVLVETEAELMLGFSKLVCKGAGVGRML